MLELFDAVSFNPYIFLNYAAIKNGYWEPSTFSVEAGHLSATGVDGDAADHSPCSSASNLVHKEVQVPVL
jgi:hypothetical protein